MLWIHKHRPESLKDVRGRENVVEWLHGFIGKRNFPNIIFYGPEGVGKRTLIFAFAHDFFGEEWRSDFARIDSSDLFKAKFLGDDEFRRIAEYYERRKKYGEVFKVVLSHYASVPPLNQPFRIIFIDNCQSLREDVQHALRRMMERYSRTCRFILSTTKLSRIIPPLRSRCFAIYVEPVKREIASSILREIGGREGLRVTDGGINAILYHSDGNLRDAICLLQICASISRKIDEKVVFSAYQKLGCRELDELMRAITQHDFGKCKSLINSLLPRMDGREILRQIHERLMRSDVRSKERISILAADADSAMAGGQNPEIHLESFVSEVISVLEKAQS